MHHSYKNFRDYGSQAGEYIGKHFDKTSDIPEQLVRAYRKYYPEITADIRNKRKKLINPAKNAYAPYRKEAHSFVDSLHRGFHRTELGLLVAGIGYLLFTGLNPNKEQPSPVEKVKEQIEVKPVQSALVALGIGFVASRILFQ